MHVHRGAVVEFLRARGWLFEQHETFVAVDVVASSGEWPLLLFMPPGSSYLIVHSIPPVEVAPHHSSNVVEYLTRANFGLSVGNFEIDLEPGPQQYEIRFKTSLDSDGFTLPVDGVRNLVDANLAVVDHYLPGLIQAVEGRPAPEVLRGWGEPDQG